MTLELLAPAKLNLTLEVLGRRDDGYHEVVSIMQTIDLADRVRLSERPDLSLVVTGREAGGVPSDPEANLALKAARLLQQQVGAGGHGALIELEKNIPAGAGLGGGSSDAAAVLRGLNHLWGLNLPLPALERLAAKLGSDVTFFLQGGTALATGRGEVIEPLPDLPASPYTLFLPPVHIEDKTRRMYAALTAGDFTDGARTAAAAGIVRAGPSLAASDLRNVFDAHVRDLAPAAGEAMAACRAAGLPTVLAGAGPAFYSPCLLDEIPVELLQQLSGRWGIPAVACCSLPGAAASDLQEA